MRYMEQHPSFHLLLSQPAFALSALSYYTPGWVTSCADPASQTGESTHSFPPVARLSWEELIPLAVAVRKQKAAVTCLQMEQSALLQPISLGASGHQRKATDKMVTH